jgi:hypothetical protein
MPRSGTKLLRDLLNNHPAIGIPAAETEFLPDWAQRWPEFGDLSDRATFQAFAERQAGSPYFVYLREEQGHQLNIDAWYAACLGFGTAAVFEALIRTDAASPRGGGRIWGDKSPGYVQHIALLNRLWPACRVIHIVRDVRDYALSIDQAWGKDRLRAAQTRSRTASGSADFIEASIIDTRLRELQALRRQEMDEMRSPRGGSGPREPLIEDARGQTPTAPYGLPR